MTVQPEKKSEYWRVKVFGRVFKLFASGGYSRADMDKLYPGAECSVISGDEFLH